MKKMTLILPVIIFSFLFTGCGIFSSQSETGGDDSKKTDTQIVTTDSRETTASETIETETEAVTEDSKKTYSGVYLGVDDYGAPETEIENSDDFKYCFDINGEKKLFRIEAYGEGDDRYTLQNKLKEGYTFEIETEDDVLKAVTEVKDEEGSSFDPVVKGVPGERTLKNFLRTALMPVGRTLYIYGGGWDWQDKGASELARTIGVSDDWSRFFDLQDTGYTYKDADPANSYFPYGHFNEYYYAGLDCSGYVGWTLYNTFENENGKEGYVFSSTENSRRLSDRGWGSLRQKVPGTDKRDDSSVHPGDVISIKGHVWLSLGTCKDGSVLMVHSTPSVSRAGQPGGGVQIGAVGYSKDCKAYKLAMEYMSEFYPEWYDRYEADIKSPAVFFGFEGDEAGIFSWDTSGGSGGLTDPEGVRNMDPVKLLKVLYGK